MVTDRLYVDSIILETFSSSTYLGKTVTVYESVLVTLSAGYWTLLLLNGYKTITCFFYFRPKDGIKAIRKRLSQNAGKNFQVVMFTLTVSSTHCF